MLGGEPLVQLAHVHLEAVALRVELPPKALVVAPDRGLPEVLSPGGCLLAGREFSLLAALLGTALDQVVELLLDQLTTTDI